MTTGTYVGMYPTIQTLKNLDEWAQDNGVQLDEVLHTTVLYSRVPVKIDTDNFLQSYSYVMPCRPIKFTSYQNANLVLLLHSDWLIRKHNRYINLGGTHDFPEYIPHITLSTGGLYPTFPKLPRFDIEFDIEYTQPLIL